MVRRGRTRENASYDRQSRSARETGVKQKADKRVRGELNVERKTAGEAGRRKNQPNREAVGREE